MRSKCAGRQSRLLQHEPVVGSVDDEQDCRAEASKIALTVRLRLEVVLRQTRHIVRHPDLVRYGAEADIARVPAVAYRCLPAAVRIARWVMVFADSRD
jgi:hypothetical protein